MRRALLATSILLAACGDDTDPADPANACVQSSASWVAQVPRIDVLVVLDRTASMARLDAQVAELADLLAGAFSDAHVAVITSELGAAVPGCDAARTAPVVPDAARCGIDGPYLRAGADRNYPGELADALHCLLDVPATACPVSQPLAAAVGALEPDGGLGDFRRLDRAYLAVVVITDSDDCSLVDARALTVPAGADEGAVDFACFAQGTICDPADPAAPGEHTACRHRPGGGLVDPLATEAFLAGLGGAEPTALVVLAGGDHVLVEGGRLGDACGAGELDAGPAPRLATLADRAEVAIAACAPDWSHTQTILDGFRIPLGVACLDPSVDRAPEVPGVQADCSVVTISDGLETEAEVVAACGDPARDPARPCWRLDPVYPGGGPDCTALFIDAGDQLTAERWATVRCAVDCPAEI